MEEALNKIDPTAIYKLTKVTTINPDSRYFAEGEGIVGQAYMFGSSLVVGDVRTSPVIGATEYKGNFQILTKNSGYVLEKMDKE